MIIFGKPQDVNKSFIVNYAPIFANLKKSEKRLIIQKSETIHYKKGALIYKQNDPPDAFYCVISGRIKIFRSEHYREEILEYSTCGMYFGIISLLTAKTHSVSAEAVNDSLILRIKKDDFNFILERVPKLAIELSKNLSEQIRIRDYTRGTQKSNIISIYSAVRGIGRTTYAINLAISLRKETKKKVIFVDFSQDIKEIFKNVEFKDTTESIDLRSLALKRDSISQFIFKASDLDIDFLNIIHNLNSESSQISPLLSILTGDYQYIIVDLPIDKCPLVFNTLAQSDSIHIITNYDTENLNPTKELFIDLFKKLEYPQEKIKLILNEKKESREVSYDEMVRSIGHDIFANIPMFWRAEDKISAESIKTVLTQPDSEFARSVRRIARQIGDVLVGLALGGGAAFGIAHVGVLKVLERENISVDIVAGTSMGALIGALWASGKSATEIENIMMEYNNKKGKVFNLLGDFCFPKSSLVGGKVVLAFLKKYLGEKTFHDIKFPLIVLACNLDRREKVVFDNGKLMDAVKSSIAIPGVFKPTIVDSNLIIDGGIIEPVPIQTLVEAGVRKIIAVNVLPSPQDMQEGFKNYKFYLEKKIAEIKKSGFIKKIFYSIRLGLIKLFSPNILDIMVNSLQALEYIIAKGDSRQANVVINPIIPGTRWFEFYKVEQLIKKGEIATENALSSIKDLINR